MAFLSNSKLDESTSKRYNMRHVSYELTPVKSPVHEIHHSQEVALDPIMNNSNPPTIEYQVQPRLDDFTYCVICKKPKPPRAQHCKKCNRCILRCDHHCPWVGNCIGFNNEKFYILLLLYTSILLIYMIIFLMTDALGMQKVIFTLLRLLGTRIIFISSILWFLLWSWVIL